LEFWHGEGAVFGGRFVNVEKVVLVSNSVDENWKLS
jgi:hypothetical protein